MFSTARVIQNFINVIQPSIDDKDVNMINDIMVPGFYENLIYCSSLLNDHKSNYSIFLFKDGSLLICSDIDNHLISINDFSELKYFLTKLKTGECIEDISNMFKQMIINLASNEKELTDEVKQEGMQFLCMKCFKKGK